MAVGKVTKIKIGGRFEGGLGEFGFVYLDTAGLFFMWWSLVWPEELTSTDRLKYSMWVSLLKEAMVQGYDVELLTDDEFSSKILSVSVPPI